MSFQDLGARRQSAQYRRPKIVAQPPPPQAEPPKRKKKSRRIVLHGKVQNLGVDESLDDDDDENQPNNTYTTLRDARVEERQRESIRERMQRKSDFSQLAAETQQFQKLVSEIAQLLEESGETPESAWRAKILFRSAQESDKELWRKLFDYEKTLLVKRKGGENTAEELRTAQTACMKLHRDFKRSHKALVMALTTYEKRQAAEVSRLGAVGWSGREEKKEEDFFDRAMREREEELERMNTSMRQVNHIYQDLAALVENQQKEIDQLQDEVQYAKGNVDAAEAEVGCFSFRDRYFCGGLPFDIDDRNWVFFRESENIFTTVASTGEEKSSDSLSSADDPSGPGIRVAERFHWYMPFETISEDLKSVKQDIVGFGQDVMKRTGS